ncbi:hypothetical protein GCM10007424_16230 [Flavobacterium suaedae]|uniref:T9SS type B sorting domain-containing protein n=1 Tax=Flavobacterium suaedae TaxID=1767027 RepID=A0ABQ1JSY1_9FLAO|nr:T9SS type B sorting domain-containing protein [Flavobacterium suaedae]GGB76927.1 hypothetical protein GCM10007424_16230 [Flavobacterium suaedae]
MKKILFTLLFITLGLSSFAQLPDFSLDIVATDETCDDNGALTFNITNASPEADFLFTIFLLPDLNNPIAVTTENTISNLDSGTYNVIAVQTLGSESNTQQESAVIENLIEDLTYTIDFVNQNCSEGGQIIINTVTGTAAEYEIISGPEVRPLQESNIFEGLAAGTYNIRVFDVCGQGVVTTYTLVSDTVLPIVSDPEYDTVLDTDCNPDAITIVNSITYPEGAAISYPLTVTYTIYPPNEDPEIIEILVYEEGVSNYLELEYELPLFNSSEQFTYDIEITNGCGISYGNSGMVINSRPYLDYDLIPTECGGYYLSLTPLNIIPPYTLQFNDSPDSFDPVLFNSMHPGPFGGNDIVITYGGDTQSIPQGEYSITLTDACGRNRQVDFELFVEVPQPTIVGRNNGCFSEFGRIVAYISERNIVSVEIIEANDDYLETHEGALPHDVSSSITSNGRVVINNLEVGDYVIRIIDECGSTYELPVTVPPFVERDFEAKTLVDCNEGFGSLQVISRNGGLVTVNLVNAPNAYEGNIPEDLSGSINSEGQLFLENLPEGEYTFQGVDACGIERTVSATVIGYQPSDNPFTFLPNCGSFDIEMTDTDTTSDSPTYWLQKLNMETGEWMHPETEVVYPEGTLPDEENSFSLPNNETTFNLTFSGDFRIIKVFESYGSTDEKLCIELLGTFNYLSNPRINSLYILSCSESPEDVYIDADGIPPLTYSIDRMNGQPFNIDNGNSNVFTGLSPASYRFVVEDGCGNVSKQNRNISVLPDLVVANETNDLVACVEEGEEISYDFNLLQQNETILGTQSPSLYTLTYHLTQSDAETGENPLPDVYTVTQNEQTIYARLIHNYISICYDMVQFQLILDENPVLDIEEYYYLCEDSYVTLTAGNGYDSYEWSTGEETSSITVEEPGNYSVIVTQDMCTSEADIIVEFSEPAEIITIDIEDWTVDENSISVFVSGIGNYEYSLDGLSYQDENVFTNLKSGIYTVYIRDINGCGIIKQDVALLNYPKFFTPNGDGINETWRIPFSWFEENLTVVIFDRYGKVITGFDANSPGWDGKYNGEKLPSTDYWFLVTREDGRIHRGHFAMIR